MIEIVSVSNSYGPMSVQRIEGNVRSVLLKYKESLIPILNKKIYFSFMIKIVQVLVKFLSLPLDLQ